MQKTPINLLIDQTETQIIMKVMQSGRHVYASHFILGILVRRAI